MFLPKYEISNRLLLSLIKVELDLNIIKNIEVPIEWQSRLKKEVIVKRLVNSLRFLGISMDTDTVSRIVFDEPGRDEQTSDVAKRLELVVKESELQAALNWVNASRLVEQIVYLSTKFKQNEVGEKDLVSINKMLGERLVVTERLGDWRKDSFVEGSAISHPKTHEILFQLEDVLLWYKTATAEKIHPILKGVVIFYELMRIRPFLHGNLITAFLYMMMTIEMGGYNLGLCAVEEELFKIKEKLFHTLATVSDSEEGLTLLMEMMVEVFAVACEKNKLRVMSVTGESVKYKTEAGRAVALTERQVALMEELTIKGQLTIKELRQVLPLISDDTILRDLKDLVAKKMIRKKGKTKGAVYVLGKVKSFR